MIYFNSLYDIKNKRIFLFNVDENGKIETNDEYQIDEQFYQHKSPIEFLTSWEIIESMLINKTNGYIEIRFNRITPENSRLLYSYIEMYSINNFTFKDRFPNNNSNVEILISSVN